MRLAVLTSGRQDWAILRSTCLLLRDDPRFELALLVGGMHCSDAFGRTERLVQADGFVPQERLAWIDKASSAVEQSSRAEHLMGESLDRLRPEALLVVGDRFETAAAAFAATLTLTPIVHLHGGEETQGAFDDQLRNAITKLSHLHLVSNAEHARRVRALGEDPTTIHVVGAPGLDNVHRSDLPGRAELERDLGIALRPPTVVVTLHPTTLAQTTGRSAEDGLGEARAVIGAMDAVDATYVVTLPNTDPGHEAIRDAMRSAGRGPRRVAVEALGDRRYWGLLRVADALLGNSSSGLIEAPALRLPVVNVGDRQAGRQRGPNVLDVPVATSEATADALRTAVSPAFRVQLDDMSSPFGDGHSAPRIVEILAAWKPPCPPRKLPTPLQDVM